MFQHAKNVFLLFGVTMILVGCSVPGMSSAEKPTTLFSLDFTTPRVLMEAKDPNALDTDLYLRAGGALFIENGVATSLTRATNLADPWFIRAEHAPADKLAHPHLTFRASPNLDCSHWNNFATKLVIVPTKHMIRDPHNAKGTDGIYLLVGQDPEFYSAGLSKDGRVLIKKKGFLAAGSTPAYGTMYTSQVFWGNYQPNGNLISPFENAKFTLEMVFKTVPGRSEITLTVTIESGDQTVFSKSTIGVDEGDVISDGSNREYMGSSLQNECPGISIDTTEFTIKEFNVTSIRE